MGKGWVRTSEQEAYLDGEFQSYLKARKDGEVKNWRSKLHEKWEERWPERQVLINEWNLADDTQFNPAQMEALGEALAARKTQLYNYVRWRTDAKPVRTQNPRTLLTRYLRKSPKNSSKKPKRKRTMIEIYNDRYYKSKLQGLVNEELKDDPEFASLPPKKKQARQFSVYLRIRAESWKNESDVVKAEIQNLFLEENEVKADQDDEENVDGNDSEIKEDDDDDNDNDDDEKILLQHQQKCIDEIGAVVASFLQDCHEATGFAWQLVGGGLNQSGEIKVVMCSAGKTTDGRKFQDTHPNWQPGLISPWYDFLKLRHPIEERHRRASLWAQPSTSETDVTENRAVITPNPETVPSPQPQISLAEPSITNPHQTTETNSTAVTSPQRTTVVACPQIQPTTVTPPIASLQCQETTVNTSFMGSQYPAANPHQTGEIISTTLTGPQTTTVVASAHIQPTSVPPPSLQCQETTVNTSTFMCSQYPTAATNLHLQTTPHQSFTILQPSSTFNNPTMSQSGTMQPPMPDSPMTQFLKSSSSGSYTWPGDNSTSTSFTPSDPFNFSMGFSDLPSSESGRRFGMDQYLNMNTQGSSPLDMSAPVDPMPMSNTSDTPTLPAAYPALPTLPNQNNTTSTSASNNGLTAPNSDYPTINNATNTLPGISAGTGKEDEKSKKRKTYEEQNAHCILPEGSHRERKKGRRTEGAGDENIPGPKKRNVNKKGKRSTGKK